MHTPPDPSAATWVESTDWAQYVTDHPIRPSYSLAKRFFDIVLSAVGLLICGVPFAILAILIKLDSKGPVFFRQVRMGRGMQPFKILKFRSMSAVQASDAAQITVGSDARITRMGAFIRRFKLDELPQLWNVFIGQMSFVGPRPEVPRYTALYPEAFGALLRHRPGITDVASLTYRDESTVLATYDDPEEAYTSIILPHKLKLSLVDRAQASLASDLQTIVRTVAGS